MLKQLIQKLLDSRTPPAQAGNSAMPGATKTIFLSKDETVGSWGIINAGTAPDDGYLFVNASAEDNTNSEVRAQLGNLFHVSAQAPAPKGLGVAIPVSKGATYSVEGAFVSHITVGFVKVIGGGYKCLVRRSLLCLRTSYNYLQKLLSRAKNLGFQNNQLLSSIRALISLAQAPRISLVTSLRATAGQLLDATQIQSQLLKSKSRTGRWHLLPFLTETLRELESVVTLKKGHRLSSCVVAEVQPIILFGSTKQVQMLNSLVGGALC